MEQSSMYYQLIQALRLLAATSEIQIEVLPSFVQVTDELALIFGDSFMIVNTQLEKSGTNAIAINKMRQIDALLHEMSSLEENWTLEALRNSSQWDTVRQEAQACLHILGEASKHIDLSWLTFIGEE